MPRIEIARLRKDHGMSQNELAQQLQINQSFLSAIENGKSPLPPEKEERLLEIFGLPDLQGYTVEFTPGNEKTKMMSEMTDSDLFNQLLNRFHQQAHSRQDDHHHHNHHERIDFLEHQLENLLTRNDRLMERNDELASDNDALRKEIDKLRTENYELRIRLADLKESDTGN